MSKYKCYIQLCVPHTKLDKDCCVQTFKKNYRIIKIRDTNFHHLQRGLELLPEVCPT